MPPMPPSIFMHFPRDDNANNSTKPADNSKPKDPPKDGPPNASLIAGLTTMTILVLFFALVVVIPWLRRRREAQKEKEKPKPPPPSISQLLDKNSRFDRSFHGHRRAPSQLNLVDPNPAYLPENRRPPAHEQPPFQGQGDREMPAVHFRGQPDEIRQVQNDRPVSYQYYIPPPNDYVDNHFPPTPTTGRNTGRLTGRRDDGDPFADQPPSSQLHPYHDIGLNSASPSPKVPDNHWDQYRGQQSSRTPHTNGLTPKSIPGNHDESSASPLTAYINHLNALGDPPATAPAFSTFNAPAAPRSAGLPYQHQQQANHQAYGSAQPDRPRGKVTFESGLSSGSDYSDSPSSRPSSSARLGVQGYGPGTRGLGYDNNVPHSMPTKGHVSFAHEQSLARAAARNGAGTALRDKFSPRPSPGMPPRSAGFQSAGIVPSSAHLSANPMKSHFSPMTPDYRQSRMPLPLDALPEAPNSSIAYGFALPPSPLSPGDEIVVSPSPYHANFAMNR